MRIHAPALVQLVGLHCRPVSVQVILPVALTPSSQVAAIKEDVGKSSPLLSADDVTLIYEPHSVVHPLKDGKALSEYGVTEQGNAILYINPNRLQLKVKAPTGQAGTISLDVTDTVQAIAKKIQAPSPGMGVPILEQELFYASKPLVDGPPIAFLSVNGSHLFEARCSTR